MCYINRTFFLGITIGFIIGVILNKYGFLNETIMVDIRDELRLYNQSISEPTNTSGYVVPNVVHFIWFGQKGKEMTFINYVSILSVHKIQKPDTIMLHCNELPQGKWWTKLLKDVTLKIVPREPPKEIYGQHLLHAYHQSDVAKFEILMEHGGIYLDYDVVLVQPLDSLRIYPTTFGKEKRDKFNAGIIVAEKNALFLKF